MKDFGPNELIPLMGAMDALKSNAPLQAALIEIAQENGSLTETLAKVKHAVARFGDADLHSAVAPHIDAFIAFVRG